MCAKEHACRVAVRVLSTKLTFIASARRGGSQHARTAPQRGTSRGTRDSRARQCAGDSTGGKTDSARQPGPAPRASGRTAVPPPRRRWVPPSSLRHHEVPDGDAKHDIIFRKVRGILNKLTPEKFQKLSDDLLGLELDSDKVLKGVILLIFEKALDEPKYSSMYAQLCKRLSEEAPNFEPPGQPCTFKLLLLNKCRTEFENRAQAFAAFEDKALLPEEEEKRHLAKCKMLGNIKFIGELGKLEILAESILHRCIQNLLARRAAAEHHEDLECLAQLVRTCGRVLDSERGRGLMDQYFARIETLSASRELAPRIRFMLRDTVELRRGGWVPRAAVTAEGPVPIHQLRHDDEHVPRRERERDRERDSLFRGGLRSRPLDDVLAGLSLQPAAALVPPPDKLFGNGFGAPRDGFRQRSAPGYYPRQGNNMHYNKHSQTSQQGNGSKINCSQSGAQFIPQQQMWRDTSSSPSVQRLTQHISQKQSPSQCSWPVTTSQYQNTGEKDLLTCMLENSRRPSSRVDPCDAFVKVIATKLRGLEKEQRLLAEKLINDIVFEAEMGNLHICHTGIAEMIRNQGKLNKRIYLKCFGFLAVVLMIWSPLHILYY